MWFISLVIYHSRLVLAVACRLLWAVFVTVCQIMAAWDNSVFSIRRNFENSCTLARKRTDTSVIIYHTQLITSCCSLLRYRETFFFFSKINIDSFFFFLFRILLGSVDIFLHHGPFDDFCFSLLKQVHLNKLNEGWIWECSLLRRSFDNWHPSKLLIKPLFFL